MGIFGRFRRTTEPERDRTPPEGVGPSEPRVFAVVPDNVEQMQRLSRGVEVDLEVAELRIRAEQLEDEISAATTRENTPAWAAGHEVDDDVTLADLYGGPSSAKLQDELEEVLLHRPEAFTGTRFDMPAEQWTQMQEDLAARLEQQREAEPAAEPSTAEPGELARDVDAQMRTNRAGEPDLDRLDELIASAGPSGAVRFDPDAPGGLRALTTDEDRALIDSIRLPEQRYADDREHLVRERDEASRNGDRDGADTAAAHLEVLDDEQRRDERADPRLPSRDELDAMADQMEHEGHTDEQARAWEYLDARRDLADERAEAEQGDDPSVVEEIDAQRTALDTEYLGTKEEPEPGPDARSPRGLDEDIEHHDTGLEDEELEP